MGDSWGHRAFLRRPCDCLSHIGFCVPPFTPGLVLGAGKGAFTPTSHLHGFELLRDLPAGCPVSTLPASPLPWIPAVAPHVAARCSCSQPGGSSCPCVASSDSSLPPAPRPAWNCAPLSLPCCGGALASSSLRSQSGVHGHAWYPWGRLGGGTLLHGAVTPTLRPHCLFLPGEAGPV